MTYVLWALLGIGAVAIVIVILLRRFRKVHVHSLFLAAYKLLRDRGMQEREALRTAIDNFRYRLPFSQLSDTDVSAFIEMLVGLDHPADVGGFLLQACELTPDELGEFRDPSSLARRALFEDVRFTIMDLMDDAQRALEHLKHHYPASELVDGLIWTLRCREGWKPKREGPDGTMEFEYRGYTVGFPHVTNGFEVVYQIIRTELRMAPSTSSPTSMIDEIRKQTVDDFDDFYAACFESLRQSRLEAVE